MKQFIYHTGITKPPLKKTDKFEICYYPVLNIEYVYNNSLKEIQEFMQLDPIALVMSKNAVKGLEKWINDVTQDTDFFGKADFVTVGKCTHDCLESILGIKSLYPGSMNSQGIIQILQKQNNTNVLLISGESPGQKLIGTLTSSEFNYFHFPVYKTQTVKNNNLSVHFHNIESNFLVITSPSCIVGIMKSLSVVELSQIKPRIISIGPTTSEAIRNNGGNVYLESEIQNIDLLYDNIENIITDYANFN